jgi:proline iminopeptidase
VNFVPRSAFERAFPQAIGKCDARLFPAFRLSPVLRFAVQCLSLPAQLREIFISIQTMGRERARFLPFVLPIVLVICCAGGRDRTPPPEVRLHPGEFTAELNGLKLWFKVSGRGPVCLMPTPAWGPSSDLYFRTLQRLEESFTVVYLDSRGTGRSERAKSRLQYTWDHLVSDLDALRAYLKLDTVWLMGHSEGGTQVLHYATRFPDRVSGLVLLNTTAVSDAESEADIESRLMRRQGQPWFADAVKALKAPAATDAEMAANVRTFLPLYWSDPSRIARHRPHFEATTMSVEAATGQVASRRYPFDLRSQLRQVTAPALIVVGDDDFICSPAAARQLHLSLPDSKLLLIEGAGHFPWLEQPEVFNAQVPSFLASLARR